MTGPEKPGDIGDPVADSIRREQNMDARPSADEVEQEHRAYLKREGCHVCGEDDPDVLEIEHRARPSCPAVQTPPNAPPQRVVCEDHAVGAKQWRWNHITDRAEGRDAVAVAVYECGSVEFVEEPEGREDEVPPMYRERPKAPIRCECGEGLGSVKERREDGEYGDGGGE